MGDGLIAEKEVPISFDYIIIGKNASTSSFTSFSFATLLYESSSSRNGVITSAIEFLLSSASLISNYCWLFIKDLAELELLNLDTFLVLPIFWLPNSYKFSFSTSGLYNETF